MSRSKKPGANVRATLLDSESLLYAAPAVDEIGVPFLIVRMRGTTELVTPDGAREMADVLRETADAAQEAALTFAAGRAQPVKRREGSKR